jgi:hypothetical protein
VLGGGCRGRDRARRVSVVNRARSVM